ncbi:MAG TPA: amino acid adenylation domain-containing protein, partial [Thermoanaerobaculia bacterium]
MGEAVEQTETRVGELPLLSAAERHQLLTEWADTATPAAPEVSGAFAPVVGQVERWAASEPGALALVSGEERVSYGELDARASRVARALRQLGVVREVRVGILLPRSIELVVAELAVWKTGGAYVPLDPSSPVERQAWLVRDLWAGQEVRLLLSHRELNAALGDLAGEADGHLLDVVELERASAGDSAEVLVLAPDPRCTAYVIYTSGSTGRPKGVEVEHGSLANLVSWHRRSYGVKPEDRATLVAGPAFDASVWELWPYLASGASVWIPDEAMRTSPAALVDWLASSEITVSFLPTPLAEAVLAEEWPERVALRALLTGGDRLHRSPRPGLPFRLINHYGPTENTVVATCAEVEAGAAQLPIGRGIENVQVRLLDRELGPAPIGVAGELCLAGGSLARGYLGRVEQTAERFVPDGFGGERGGRLYRTGDLVRYLADGRLEFLGRLDHQVKVRGVRIELGEIEAALLREPGVEAAVVLARAEPGGSVRLVGYLVTQVAETDLRIALARELPEAMVPSSFVRLDALPLTQNGKVDRRALAALAAEPVSGERRFARTPTEELLSGLWSELLGVDAVGVDESFFALGGHSLLATRLVSRVSGAFGLEMPLRWLFESPTVEGLAERIESARAAGSGLGAVSIERVSRELPLPLSFAQERMWFLWELEPESAAYNVPAALRMSGELDLTALRASVRELVRRHEPLRTTFGKEEGSPVQRIAAAAEAGVLEVELASLDGRDAEAEAARLAVAEGARPFDLARGPLVRVTLLRLAPGESVLLVTMHHIVSDA